MASRSRHGTRRWLPYAGIALLVRGVFLTLLVLSSQSTLTRLSDRRAHLDLQVNLLAEQESTKTVALLERIAQELDISLPSDCDERELASPTDIHEGGEYAGPCSPRDWCRADPQTQEGSTDDTPRTGPRT